MPQKLERKEGKWKTETPLFDRIVEPVEQLSKKITGRRLGLPELRQTVWPIETKPGKWTPKPSPLEVGAKVGPVRDINQPVPLEGAMKRIVSNYAKKGKK